MPNTMTDTSHPRLPAQERPEPFIRSSAAPSLMLPVFTISSCPEMTRLRAQHPEPFLALSPDGAGNSFGIPWWLDVVQEQKAFSILDCGASAALARMALLAGIGWVVCQASSQQMRALKSDKLQETRVLTARPSPTSWRR